MATLEDLLALLPDNDTGAIDAADLRTIVTELWTEGAAVSARVTALEESNGGGAVTVAGTWQVNPMAGAVPGAGQVTAETGDIATSSWLRITKRDMLGADYTLALTDATSLYGQQAGNSANRARVDVTSISDEGDYFQIEYDLDSAVGDGSGQWQNATVVIYL